MATDLITDIIVMGGCGRMGGTLVRMAQNDPDLHLKAVIERAERLDELERLDCQLSADLDEVLPQSPRAVVVEFTSPEATVEHVGVCKRHATPHRHRHHGTQAGPVGDHTGAAMETPCCWPRT
jgi:4-hydroxy-tetrahydrodipicolinate reductase